MEKPVLSREQAMELLETFHLSGKVIILGIRGFFDPPEGNKHGVYDDALFIITPDACEGYNGNTDPSVDREGIAVLKPGAYTYRKGLHGLHHLNLDNPNDKKIYDSLIRTGEDLPPVPGKVIPYWAFRQAGDVTIFREGEGEYTDSPEHRFWIDIHCGGEWTTSSEGCQTVVKEQWQEFRTFGFEAMEVHQEEEIAYVLIAKVS